MDVERTGRAPARAGPPRPALLAALVALASATGPSAGTTDARTTAPLAPAPTVAAATAPGAATPSREDGPIPVLVLDFELVGDLGDAALVAEHARLLDVAADALADAVGALPRYRVVDEPGARERMAAISRSTYLHACNGCERTLARDYGADRVVVPWVYRVSALVLTLNAQIRDVASGAVLFHRSLDFRGDNERAWRRAIDYLVREIDEEGP